MAVFKVIHKNNYTIIDNSVIRDTNLSLQTLGLLLKVFSLPADWNFSIEGLSGICKDGHTAISSSLKEMEKLGYLVRERVRNDKGAIVDMQYNFYEKPQVDYPRVGNPNVDYPNVENGDNKINNNKVKNNKRNNIYTKFSKPTIKEIETYCQEKGYYIDPEHFYNYYESKGWVVGKAPMKNWKAAVSNWNKNDFNKKGKKAEPLGDYDL